MPNPAPNFKEWVSLSQQVTQAHHTLIQLGPRIRETDDKVAGDLLLDTLTSMLNLSGHFRRRAVDAVNDV